MAALLSCAVELRCAYACALLRKRVGGTRVLVCLGFAGAMPLDWLRSEMPLERGERRDVGAVCMGGHRPRPIQTRLGGVERLGAALETELSMKTRGKKIAIARRVRISRPSLSLLLSGSRGRRLVKVKGEYNKRRGGQASGGLADRHGA